MLKLVFDNLRNTKLLTGKICQIAVIPRKMSFKKRIFFRIFPAETPEFEHIKLDTKTNTIYVRYLQELSKNNIKTGHSYWKFKTDGILYNLSQEMLYKNVTAGVLEE